MIKLEGATALAAALLLSACTTHLSRIDDGRTDAPVWPAVGKAHPLAEQTTHPNRDVFAHLVAGASKDDVYRLLGHPHYREGALGVHEWDYAFQLPDGQGGTAACQYKVLFNDDMKLSQTFWNPVSCAEPLQARANEEPRPQVVGTVELPADVLFAFDSAHLSPEAAAAINGHVLAAMRATGATGVHVVGYTDRLGGDAYNRRLSMQRAQAVKAYLVEHGIAGDLIATEGRGASEPLVQCSQQSRVALMECLKPNRRVRFELLGR